MFTKYEDQIDTWTNLGKYCPTNMPFVPSHPLFMTHATLTTLLTFNGEV